MYADDSGEISITAPGVLSSFLYRSDSVGKYSECGVGALETVSSNSGFSSALPGEEAYGDVGETTSSCHMFFA